MPVDIQLEVCRVLCVGIAHKNEERMIIFGRGKRSVEAYQWVRTPPPLDVNPTEIRAKVKKIMYHSVIS